MKETASVCSSLAAPGTEPLRTHPAGLAPVRAGSASSHTSHGFVLPHEERLAHVRAPLGSVRGRLQHPDPKKSPLPATKAPRLSQPSPAPRARQSRGEGALPSSAKGPGKLTVTALLSRRRPGRADAAGCSGQ